MNDVADKYHIPICPFVFCIGCYCELFDTFRKFELQSKAIPLFFI